MNLTKDPLLNYAEQTGPVYRVGILLDDEEKAVEHAEGIVGVSHAWTDKTSDGWEIVFEMGAIL